MAELTDFPEIFPQSEILVHLQLQARRQLDMIIAGVTKDKNHIKDYWYTLESMVVHSRWNNPDISCYLWHDRCWRAMYNGELLLFARFANNVWYYDFKAARDFEFKSSAYYSNFDDFKKHMVHILTEGYPKLKVVTHGGL